MRTSINESSLKLRGHHYKQLENLLFYKSRLVNSKDNHSLVQGYLKKYISRYKSYLLSEKTLMAYQLAVEYVGSNQEGLTQFLESFAHGLLLFLNMKATDEIIFHTTQDFICNGCHDGKHCSNQEEIDGDLIAIEYICSICKSYKIPFVVMKKQKQKSGKFENKTVITRIKLTKEDFIKFIGKDKFATTLFKDVGIL